MSDQIHQGFQEAKGALDGDLSRDASRTLSDTVSGVVEHTVGQILQGREAKKAEEQQSIIQTADRLLNSDGVSIGAQSQPSQNHASLPRRIINYRGIVDPDNRVAVAATLRRIKDRVTAISSPRQSSKSSQNRDSIPEPPPYDSSEHFLYGEENVLEDISSKLQDSSFITDSSREKGGEGSSEWASEDIWSDVESDLSTNTEFLNVDDDSALTEDTERIVSVADTVFQGSGSPYTDTYSQAQNNVVSVSDAIVPPTADQHSVNTGVDISEAVTQRRYEGDEVSITRTGNIVEIYQDSELVFKYKYENGRPKVLKDEITGRRNPYLEEKFNNIYNRMIAAAPVPEHRPGWIRQVLSDKTGQSQVTNLGPLAPKGSKAIATANMLTTEDRLQRVVTDNGQVYRYSRTSTKDEAGNQQSELIVINGDGKIIARSANKGIEGSAQTSADFSRVAKHYDKVKAQVIKRNAASKAKSQDMGGR